MLCSIAPAFDIDNRVRYAAPGQNSVGEGKRSYSGLGVIKGIIYPHHPIFDTLYTLLDVQDIGRNFRFLYTVKEQDLLRLNKPGGKDD